MVSVDLAEAAELLPAVAAVAAEALPDPPLPVADEAVVARPLDAPEGERDNAVPRTVGPREGDTLTRAAPAADQGEDGGHLRALATRRDRSTLQSRIADSDADAQPAHLRTSSHAASPQAERRERRTGVGDQVLTTDATRPPSAAAPEPPPAPAAPRDVAGPTPGQELAARVDQLALARVSDDPRTDRGVGPLAVESGARSFDVDARGRAADDTTMRAASSAAHPGITDFSHAGAPAPEDSLRGRGPGSAPGAVARPAKGQAPAVYGVRSPRELAADAALRTREREYDRYKQGIAQRLGSVLKFPRNLLLHLEQGEAVVTFALHPDGSLAARPKLVKSSGFQEFDAEAVDVVLRAAPFARRTDTADMTFMVPVTFENPVVR
jgi:TonB family protein